MLLLCCACCHDGPIFLEMNFVSCRIATCWSADGSEPVRLRQRRADGSTANASFRNKVRKLFTPQKMIPFCRFFFILFRPCSWHWHHWNSSRLLFSDVINRIMYRNVPVFSFSSGHLASASGTGTSSSSLTAVTGTVYNIRVHRLKKNFYLGFLIVRLPLSIHIMRTRSSNDLGYYYYVFRHAVWPAAADTLSTPTLLQLHPPPVRPLAVRGCLHRDGILAAGRWRSLGQYSAGHAQICRLPEHSGMPGILHSSKNVTTKEIGRYPVLRIWINAFRVRLWK